MVRLAVIFVFLACLHAIPGAAIAVPAGSAFDSSTVNVPSWAEPLPPPDRPGGASLYPSGGATPHQPDPPPPPVRIPIDSGLSWLFVAGMGFGVYRLHAGSTNRKGRDVRAAGRRGRKEAMRR